MTCKLSVNLVKSSHVSLASRKALGVGIFPAKIMLVTDGSAGEPSWPPGGSVGLNVLLSYPSELLYERVIRTGTALRINHQN
jgi:hypothetical protein